VNGGCPFNDEGVGEDNDVGEGKEREAVVDGVVVCVFDEGNLFVIVVCGWTKGGT
jgi:hypothetical protein